MTRSVENRHRDVLGSRKLPVERDGRFPTTKICSHTDPLLLPLSAFTLAAPSGRRRFLPTTTPLSSSSLSAPIYLSFSSYTRDTRTCARRELCGNGKGRKALSGIPSWCGAMNKTAMQEEDSQYRIRARLIIGQVVTVSRSARHPVVAIKLYECILLPRASALNNVRTRCIYLTYSFVHYDLLSFAGAISSLAKCCSSDFP